MGKQPSKDTVMSILGICFMTSQSTPSLAQPIDSECWEVETVWKEEDQHKPALLASEKVSDYAIE
jgi:predicted HNH restriction endonuclease